MLLAAVALVVIAGVFADSGAGHKLLVRAIDSYRLSNGLRLHIGAIDGSIYGRMRLRDLVVSDERGPFLRSPEVTLAWRPLELVSKHVQLQEVSAARIDLLRKPVLKAAPARPNRPLLPTGSITVQRLSIGDLTLEPGVAGARRRLRASGQADLAGGRAKLLLDVSTQPASARSGVDQLHLDVDVDPPKNRLVLQAHASGPADGTIAGLIHVREPVVLDLAGRGDWRSWRGRLDAAVGGNAVLDADVAESLGRLNLRGTAAPARLLTGAIARLADPSVTFDITGSLKNRVIGLEARLASARMMLALTGGVGLADSTFRSMKVALQLPDPAVALPRLTGSRLRASFTLNRAMAAPAVDYALSAATIGFGQEKLEGLKASGEAELGSGSHLHLSVHGSAKSLRAPGKLDGLVRDIRLDGDIAGQWTGAVTGRIALAASTFTLIADVSGSTRTSTYRAKVSGGIGQPVVRALGLQGLLGGAAAFKADLVKSPKLTQVTSLDVTAPGLRITSASGRVTANGALVLQASAQSTAYGPLSLSAGGTLSDPQVHLVAAHPKIGVQLTNLDASLTGSGGTFHLSARAGSPYGPVTADVGLSSGARTIDVRSLAVAGLTLSGRLTRTPQGPVAGRLALSGDGLDGTVLLSASGSLQAADLQLRARNARVPLAPPVSIAAGAVNGRLVLSPSGPVMTAHAQLRGVRRGNVVLTQARADVDCRNAAGKADFSAAGDAGAPFTLASTASFSPGVIELDTRGSLNRLDFHLAKPARIVRGASAWRLEPATVVLASGGQLDIAGAYGDGISLQLGLSRVDLAMSRAFAPTLGLAGKASGTAQLSLPAGGGMPRGRAVLQLTGVTRSGEFTVSQPVDVAVLATLAEAGAEASVAIRRQGAVIGRVQARVAPGRSGANWIARLREGTISGGLRYEGPSEALVALAGLAGQELSGPIAIGVDWSGPVAAPQLRGLVRARRLAYEDSKFGTRIDDIGLEGSFSGTRLQLQSLTGRAGRGTVSASGFVDLSLSAGLPVDLKVILDHAQLARSSDLSAAISGAIRVTNGASNGGLVSGDLTLDSARYVAARNSAAKVPELTGVHRIGAPVEQMNRRPVLPISRWKLDLRVRAPNQVFVTGMGLDSEWRADLRITGDLNHPVAIGDIDIIRGTFSFAGRQLQVSEGRIHLDGSDPPDPTLMVTASATAGDVTATIDIAGTAQDPQISFSSTPALPQDEVLSRLLFGASTPQLSPIQAIQLAASLNALRGGAGGLDVLGRLRQAIGVQDLTVSSGQNGEGPSLGIGKYIGDKIYIQVTTDARGLAATEVQIALTRALSLITQISALGDSNLSLRYSHRY